MKKSNLGYIQTFADQFMPPANYPKNSKGKQKMKSKNVSNYNDQEKQEVLSKIKAYLQVDETQAGFTHATLVNYQEKNENGTKHYEVYETTIFADEKTTVEEIDKMQTEKQKLVKTYKTKRGFLEAFLNNNDVAGKKYKIYTML